MLYGMAVGLFLVFSSVLILLIVIQDWKTANLGSSLGLQFAGESVSFGTDLPFIIRSMTAWMICFFLVFALSISCWTVHIGRDKPVYDNNSDVPDQKVSY